MLNVTEREREKPRAFREAEQYSVCRVVCLATSFVQGKSPGYLLVTLKAMFSDNNEDIKISNIFASLFKTVASGIYNLIVFQGRYLFQTHKMVQKNTLVLLKTAERTFVVYMDGSQTG